MSGCRSGLPSVLHRAQPRPDGLATGRRHGRPAGRGVGLPAGWPPASAAAPSPGIQIAMSAAPTTRSREDTTVVTCMACTNERSDNASSAVPAGPGGSRPVAAMDGGPPPTRLPGARRDRGQASPGRRAPGSSSSTATPSATATCREVLADRRARAAVLARHDRHHGLGGRASRCPCRLPRRKKMHPAR
jgi:hypothetical protein